MKNSLPRRLSFASAVPALLLAAGLAAVPAVSSPGPAQPSPQSKIPSSLQPGEESKPRPVTMEQVPLGALVPQGPSPSLAVLATGDVVGYLEPCG